MRKKRIWKRFLSVVLTVTVLSTTLSSDLAAFAAEIPQGEESQAVQESGDSDQASESSQGSVASDIGEAGTADTEALSVSVEQNVYVNGSLQIYNAAQLAAVGTGTQVYSGDESAETFGTGDAVTDENGNPVVYANDASYVLMNDIPLDSGNMWQLPAGFAGSFNGAEITADAPIYDAESDTIYVYNNYQLATINDPGQLKTVMSNDMIAEEFGMGQIVYADAGQTVQLEYTAEHNYVLSKDFTEEMPETKAEELIENDGRKFPGQVIFKVGQTDYILIGNEDQLRAIGSNQLVYTAVYQARLSGGDWVVDKDEQGNSIMLYGGDADLTQEQNGKKDYQFGVDGIDSASGTLTGRCGVNQVTGEIDPEMNIENSGHSYTTTEHYIIFRDINFEKTGKNSDGEDTNWEPLMFQGTMIGAKNMSGIDVENGAFIEGVTPTAPVLSNINIQYTDTELDMSSSDAKPGIGFFATLGAGVGTGSSDLFKSKGHVEVKNLTLQDITVDNHASKIAEPDLSLISFLLRILEVFVGGLLELLGIDSVSDLLDALIEGNSNDLSNLATGCFAGKIFGDVEVSNCKVVGGDITSAAGMSGGFAGTVDGLVEYDVLSDLLEGLVEVLSSILGYIPLLGLGNLVDNLLNGGVLDVSKLIPTGYHSAVLKNCSVENINADTGIMGTAGTDFNGAFAGKVRGAIMQSCSVVQDSNLTVQGAKYTGGFAGEIANYEVNGLLNQLDITSGDTYWSSVVNQSVVVACEVRGQGTVSVAATGDYAGGFTGLLANSYAIDTMISNAGNITTDANYAGGFAGYTSLGDALAVGDDSSDENGIPLASDVIELLKEILAGEGGADTPLLSLLGINPSYVYGCKVSGNRVTVSGKNYVGGFTGRADGTEFGTSTSESVSVLKPIEKGKVIYETPKGLPCTVENLSSVTADEGYAAGFIGLAATASAGGIIDGALIGVANFLPVKADGVVISGTSAGLTITNTNGIAAGGCAVAVGAQLNNVQIRNLGSVTSKEDAAGFIGQAGVGGLADATGLNLLGLVSLSGIISVAQAMTVTVNNSDVIGIADGFTVETTGADQAAGEDEIIEHRAGGFIAKSASADVTGSTVNNLKKVSTVDKVNGFAGGFVGVSHTGGLAELGDVNTETGLINVSSLLSAVQFLTPSYTNCVVSYKEDVNSQQVEAACAGGFAGKLESGKIDNSGTENTAVKNICNVQGRYYAGGFTGFATSGGLVASKGGIQLLGTTIQLDGLLSVLNVYIPEITNAGVDSAKGLTVTCDGKIENETTAGDNENVQADTKLYEENSGSAGGFIGYGSGVQISGSNVNKLRYTTVQEPDDLQQQDGSSYFDEKSNYAVRAARYAGGYVGKLDIGNAASVGNGLGALNHLTDVESIGQVLATVSSSIENSDVTGDVGGYAVLADGTDTSDNDKIGNAGGFAGSVNGSMIRNSDAHNFAYIIGQETAGGYVGNMEPGDVADLIGDVNVLGGLLTGSNLVSALQTFIPRIYSSSTDAVPCGGVVRAESESSDNGRGGIRLRGVAGGYAGHNNGGRIDGETEGAKAVRIRSVYGYEYAGGFTGYLHNADLVNTGSLSLLFGLVKLDNPLGAFQAVYATETNTSVTGPLRDLTFDRFKGWYENVGAKGPYGDQFKELANGDEANYNEKISKYYYGYQVTAGRDEIGENSEKRAGIAGGYAGKMTGSVITNGQAYDLQKVEAMRSAGGFVGETAVGSLVNVGSIDVADITLTNGLPVLQTFVPVIYNSSVRGYTSGAEIIATGSNGDQENNYVGNAGGYVGFLLGGTITGNADAKCAVEGLKYVESKEYAGGYAGLILPGSLLTVDSNTQDGLLEKLLGILIDTPNDLASVLNATLSRVTYSEVSSYSEAGFVVNGAYKANKVLGEEYRYAEAAGGYVGMIQGGIIGDINDANAGASVRGVKSVTAGEYAGGFVGLGDVAAVAEISAGGTNILDKLLGVGALDALDAFRTYIYNSKVTGSTASGLTVTAKEGQLKESQDSGNYIVYSGSAGGFAGTLLNGSIKESSVEELKHVEAANYSGGFIGHSGKSGTVDLDELGLVQGVLGNLLGANAGVIDVCGSTINNSTVKGMEGGYTVKSSGGEDEIAGGFIGNGDLARMEGDTVLELKQVASDGTAGGFIGQTSFAYLVDVGVNSDLLQPVINLLLELVTALLQPDKLPADGGILQIDLGPLLKVNALYKNGVLSAELLGLKISVELGELDADGLRQIKVNIDDSSITIKTSGDTVTQEQIQDVIKISLIKANRTRVADSKVTGIAVGYDVFGDGADNENDGKGDKGYAGGFVGYINEGLLENNNMIQADTIRGASGKIGEFSGASCLESSYDFNTLQGIEGENNYYYVYRMWDTDGLTHVYSKDHSSILSQIEASDTADAVIGGISYYVYPVKHMEHTDMYKHEDVWNGAYQTTSKNIAEFPINVYVSSAQADLMLGTPTYENESDPEGSDSVIQDPCDVNGEHIIEKIWMDDGNSQGTRPGSIQVTLQPGLDGDAVPDGETAKGQEIEMNDSMAGSDEDVWSTTADAPINYEDAEGNLHKYAYNVVEDPIVNESGDQIYATIYDNLDNYTHRITNYLPSELIQEDTVVIDYGLSVDIDVLTNDEALSVGGKLAAVRMKNGEADTWDTSLIGKVTNELEGDFNSDAIWKAELAEGETPVVADGEHGSAQIKTETNEIRFTPDTMSMESVQEIMYAVQLPDNNGQLQYVYGLVTVVPATKIYYEDNYGAIHYKNGSIAANAENITGDIGDTEDTGNTTEIIPGFKNHGKWQLVGEEANSVQDTDRPGETEIEEAIENVYGNDTHYTNCSTYSNGSSYGVRVSALNMAQEGGTHPKATFTFKGTGFDLISLTSRKTGAVRVKVYKGTSAVSANLLSDDIVDTYYGYTYNAASGKWELDEDSNGCLYQIPILKKDSGKEGDLKGYGEYYVEITPLYSDMYDMYNDRYYDFYLDAVRIYDPANAEAGDYERIENVYNTDNENHPDYTELRDILKNAANVSGEIPNGAVFVDGNGELSNIEAYESFGPKNEVYLAPGQAVSFYLWTNVIPEKVQISAKLAMGERTKLGIASAVQEGDSPDSPEWKFYKDEQYSITTAYDMYYDFTNQCVWEKVEGNKEWQYRTKYPIVIANPTEKAAEGEAVRAVLSLTNLQWTGRNEDLSMGDQPGTDDGTKPGDSEQPQLMMMAAQPADSAERMMVSTAPENIAAAYYYINRDLLVEEPDEGDGGDVTDPEKPEEPEEPENPEKPEEPENPEEPEKPEEPENPGQSGDPDITDPSDEPDGTETSEDKQDATGTSGNIGGQTDGGQNEGSVQTGDNNMSAPLFVLLAVSGALTILTVLRTRKRQK